MRDGMTVQCICVCGRAPPPLTGIFLATSLVLFIHLATTSVDACLRPVYSDTTQLDVELSTRSQREQLSPINERSDPVDSVCRS